MQVLKVFFFCWAVVNFLVGQSGKLLFEWKGDRPETYFHSLSDKEKLIMLYISTLGGSGCDEHVIPLKILGVNQCDPAIKKIIKNNFVPTKEIKDLLADFDARCYDLPCGASTQVGIDKVIMYKPTKEIRRFVVYRSRAHMSGDYALHKITMLFQIGEVEGNKILLLSEKWEKIE